jgi:crossover junction endodeoxyribonuclease RusA
MDKATQENLELGSHMVPVHLELPWPPSINSYFMEYPMPPAGGLVANRIQKHGTQDLHVWLRRNSRVMKRVGDKGHEYRAAVQEYVLRNRLNKGLREPLIMGMDFYPPDRRERDLDNHYKPLTDALEHACVFENDSQIKGHVTRMHDDKVIKGGKVVVSLQELIY